MRPMMFYYNFAKRQDNVDMRSEMDELMKTISDDDVAVFYRGVLATPFRFCRFRWRRMPS
jgi:hypothetical protein